MAEIQSKKTPSIVSVLFFNANIYHSFVTFLKFCWEKKSSLYDRSKFLALVNYFRTIPFNPMTEIFFRTDLMAQIQFW